MDPSLIDIFSGAGGLSAGLERAGWQTVAAIDSDSAAIASLKASQARRLLIPGDSNRSYLQNTNIVGQDIASITGDDLRPRNASANWRPTLLAGGPPCQPFSSAGKQLGVQDPRGTLFMHFVRLAAELRPRFVLFENVRGLVTARCPDGKPGGVLQYIQQQFERIGYACRFQLLNAADFGAPQRRVRLVMLASEEFELPAFPEPSHAPTAECKLLGLKPWVSLRRFLASFPPPDPADIVRPSGQKAKELSALSPGTGLRAAGIVEANRPSGHWGYRQDSFLADQDLPSRTIRAATTPDWIQESDGLLRRLTWKECAALQGFPEQWQFVGSKAAVFRQIGNAVEGRVAHAIGVALLEHALVARKQRPTSPEWPREFLRSLSYTTKEDIVNGHLRKANGDGRCPSTSLRRRSGPRPS